MLNRTLLLVTTVALAASLPIAAQTKRALTLDDHSKIVAVGDPQRSPDGQWVAYTVSTIDASPAQPPSSSDGRTASQIASRHSASG